MKSPRRATRFLVQPRSQGAVDVVDMSNPLVVPSTEASARLNGTDGSHAACVK